MVLGMEGDSISNADINATSEFDDQYKAHYARLYETKDGGCWAANKFMFDPYPYLQVDFLKIKDIIGIYTQGCDDELSYVKTYSVSYSNDEINFQHILDQNGNPKVRSTVKYTVVRGSGVEREWCCVESSKRGMVLRGVRCSAVRGDGIEWGKIGMLWRDIK